MELAWMLGIGFTVLLAILNAMLSERELRLRWAFRTHHHDHLKDELAKAYAVRQLHTESLKGREENLFEYLSGWFGGPSLYIAKNSHSRLRMRQALGLLS
jgi:hypothetical protein